MVADPEKGSATVIEEETLRAVEVTLHRVDNTDECLGGCLKRLRSFWWWIIGALIIAIPFALTATVFRSARAEPISLVGLFFWLELSWLALWALYFAVWCGGLAWHWFCCRLDPLEIVNYREALHDLKVHLTLFLWTIVSWAIVPALCYFDDEECVLGWISTFQTVLLGVLISSAIIFAKCFVVEVVLTKAAIRYRSLWRDDLVNSREIIRMFLRKEVKPTVWDSIHNVVMHPALGKMERYLEGRGDEASYKAVREEILDKIHRSPEQYSGIIRDHMESLGIETSEDKAEDAIWFVEDTGKGLEAALIGEESIKKSVGHLNVVLTILALPAIAIVFVALFTSNLNDYLTPLWATVAGLSFAFSGTAQEYLAACTFVFSQQPYSVGDRVVLGDYGTLPFIVDEIHLGYTTFRNNDNGRVSQIRHSRLCTMKIDNLSRSVIHHHKDTFCLEPRVSSITGAQLKEIKARIEQCIARLLDVRADADPDATTQADANRGIRINRYLNHSVRIGPHDESPASDDGTDSKAAAGINWIYIDIRHKEKIGVAYEELLSYCERRLQKELRKELSQELESRQFRWVDLRHCDAQL